MRLVKNRLLLQLFRSTVDLLPILVVIAVFQLAIIRQPLANTGQLLAGMACVVVGLTFFIEGLELSLFPIGEAMAGALARKGSLFWLLVFAFLLGFAATVAEPALLAICNEAANIASEGKLIAATGSAKQSYVQGLRFTVATASGAALLLGVLRILKGWPLHRLIIGGYTLIIVITPFAPPGIVGIAYDSGSIATSTITIPLVTALGVGLSTAIKGRNPVTDGFGMIALASLNSMIFVMAYGMLQ
ncbi:MAG: hypothetical protein CTY29_03515 [Methylobacter sp.]|nr:MAG: hypothetical protein CTY29_03515 [Methylobacter sp.]PPD23699.1 MAG: hypothetical protein CTY24_03460 [Methylobacter sp.]PPD32531.1 MAG: hypothetical protein CTY18_10485 [Methylomonas sp.]